RQREVAFEDSEPTVLIIGGGQSGLDVAARLKSLGDSHLVVEKNARIGDSWRNRYEALCLHDPVWYDHMPYLPFPPNWPAYSPFVKLAGWLERYAEFMELNVWTSSTVTSARYDTKASEWKVTVSKGDGTERVFNHVKHVIFATGLAGGEPNMPSYPGMHKRAADHAGKKVVVIASDYYLNGVVELDVTMYQRSSSYIMSTKNGWGVLFAGLYSEDGPPTNIADRLNASFPNVFMSSGMAQRAVKIIAELDNYLVLIRVLQATFLMVFTKSVFRTNLGINGDGLCRVGVEVNREDII
ncbi:hypothetical protein MPER_06778, partial [Moniliophthora perniciosa FA553]